MIILLVFILALLIGVFCNFWLFSQDQKKEKNTRFLTSERLLVFVIEILIAVIGFGVTLTITNENEHQMEKAKAVLMIEQTIEYTDNQIAREKSYLNMYNKGKITGDTLVASNVISLDYYKNILSNETVLQNVNMKTYGEVMQRLAWVEGRDARAKTAETDKQKYSGMYYRYKYLKDVRELLSVCHKEMSGEISSEEAQELCKEIKYGDEDDSK